MTKLAVLGAGSWGTTFAKVLADGGSQVMVWARRKELAREIAIAKHNPDYLPGISLPESLSAHSDINRVLEGASQVYLAIPSQSLRQNLSELKGLLEDDIKVISLMKGVEKDSGMRMSQVVQSVLGIDPGLFAVASGPNLAMEIAHEEPTATVISSSSWSTANEVARVARNHYFHSFINDDVIGTEFGGVLKNLIAVAVGIVDGVGYGENTKASIITRGLAEITRFTVAHGGKAQTMAGLAGLGDLIATCESPLSRNNQAGRLLGQGASYSDVVETMQQTAEGLSSVGPILALAEEKGIEMPIVSQVARVLAGTMDPKQIAPQLTSDDGVPVGEY